MAKKDPTILLDQILESIDLIFEYTASVTPEEFKADGKTKDAILMHLIVIGEAANKLPEDFRKKHHTIEWMRIIRTRHIIAHEYGRVDFDIIWRIITLYLPEARESLRKLYREL